MEMKQEGRKQFVYGPRSDVEDRSYADHCVYRQRPSKAQEEVYRSWRERSIGDGSEIEVAEYERVRVTTVLARVLQSKYHTLKLAILDPRTRRMHRR